MSKPKAPLPYLTSPPEFSAPGSLARVLKKEGAAAPAAPSKPTSKNQDVWTVLGIGPIWQTAAENAARGAGQNLAQWLTETIERAAQSQGIRKK